MHPEHPKIQKWIKKKYSGRFRVLTEGKAVRITCRTRTDTGTSRM